MLRKNKIIVISIGIVMTLALATYAFLWILSTNELREEAVQQLNKVQAYETLEDRIIQETSRCQQFISQESGQFGEFEYCQRFISWRNSLDLINN